MTSKISRSQVFTQPNPTQPMDGPNPWPTLRQLTQAVDDDYLHLRWERRRLWNIPFLQGYPTATAKQWVQTVTLEIRENATDKKTLSPLACLYLINFYLRQGGYVFFLSLFVCLLVGWFVCEQDYSKKVMGKFLWNLSTKRQLIWFLGVL